VPGASHRAPVLARADGARADDRPQRDLGNWIAIYGFAQIYDGTTVFDGIGPGWSLAVEARCYLLLPVFAILARRLTIGGSWLRGELAGIAILIRQFRL
jgi:peptidoglycan/LPS O-acetylase OafA/YrhL